MPGWIKEILKSLCPSILLIHTVRTLFIILLFIPAFVLGQRSANNFRHLTPNEGLSNETIRGIGIDQYGFMWFGTNFGLNRFDGIHVKSWFHKPHDSTSLANDFVRSLLGDSKGRIWIGGDPGFCQYDYPGDAFIRYANSEANITDIAEDNQGRIWVATNFGLRAVDTIRRTLVEIYFPSDSAINALLHSSLRDIHCTKKGELLLATWKGVLVYDPASRIANLLSATDAKPLLPDNDITAVTSDNEGNIWVGSRYMHATITRIAADRQSFRSYNHFYQKGKKFTPNTLIRLYTDHDGNIWTGSTYSGLAVYDKRTDQFIDYQNDPVLPNSINGASAISILEDRSGMIWVGSEGFGVNYFNPRQDVFDWILLNKYLPTTIPGEWCRAVITDQKKQLWIGTGKGLAIMNSSGEVIRSFVNDDSTRPDLHSLSIRSLMEDNKGRIWIGTASGLNRFDPVSGQMKFYSDANGIPTRFTWFVHQLKDGRIVVGTNLGLFLYSEDKDSFTNAGSLPALKDIRFSVRCFKEASNGFWWIGTFNNGVVVFNPATSTVVRHLQHNGERNGLSNNYIHDIQEDKEGNIWIATRNKLNYYLSAKDSVIEWGTQEGLPNNWIGGVLIDSLSRIWVSTGNGLCVMDRQNRQVKNFGLRDGLLTTQFNDQPGYITPSGQFLFTSMKGVAMVDPRRYNWQDSMPVPYLTSFTVAGKAWKGRENLESVQNIHLGPFENFFSIEMIGLQYYTPDQVWYAYKLEGLNEDWIYTRERLVNYTNVPGGDYVFRYKASTRFNQWNVPEKTLFIHVATVFYKTWWFRTLVVLLILLGLLLFYRYRIRQKEKMMQLEGKAQSLEKEKALVMYENLKQQLNPHFLFNSLTSLSGLIETDQKLAGNFLEQMSKIYRYILKNRDSETVSLKEEIDFVQVFINLQKTRFKDGLMVEVKVDPDLLKRKIVPVTLQNMVENAIKHNIIDAETPLKISIVTEGENIMIRNNLQKKNKVESSNMQGLVSLRSLYHYLTDKPVVVKETKEYFQIAIPLLS